MMNAKVPLILTSFFLLLSAVISCPAICVCKWKNGKQTVECADKGLSSLPAEIEPGTQVLVFNGNNLPHLQRHAFVNRNLFNLQKINLANCNLGKIDDKAFDELSNLIELDLSYNLLTDIPSFALKHTPALRHLNLAGNLIGTIPAHSFTHVSGLVYLDISNTKLHYISPAAFQPLNSLETLQIQENNIKELPEPIVRKLEDSHGIRVHDNPWICDCRALPLWRLLEKRRIPHPVTATCNSPRRMAGMQFDALEERDFACPPTIRPVINIVRGVAGENATVTCPVEGQPPPEVLWFIEDRPVLNGSILGLGPQRVYIVNGGHRHKVSHLVITGAQEADSGQIRCIAINPAGRATANFTLAVTMKAIFQEPLNTGHIAGISIGLIVLAIIIFIVAFFLFARTRSAPSPTPGKERTPPISFATSSSEPNPIQKPPRLTDLSASSSADPDLISEAEKSARGNGNYSNGYLPNGRTVVPSVSDVGDYTRMEGDSLYPSGLWDAQQQGPVIHEHYNPGFVSQETPIHGPIHSTPLKVINEHQNYDPQMFGYPHDYGLPIPEMVDENIYGSKHETTLTSDDDKQSYGSRNEMSQLNQNATLYNQYHKQQSPNHRHSATGIYSLLTSPSHNMRVQENKLAEDITLQEMGNISNVATSSENLPHGQSMDRSWISGSQNSSVVPHGVPVLPPLPNNTLHRLKARDSPDEGYQEGTEV